MNDAAPTFVVAFAGAALVGFAAHRASLCNVRVVADLVHRGDATPLLGLLQAVLWASLIGVPWMALGGHVAAMPQLHQPWPWAVAGGALFGVGAAINGGCSLSTLHRLIDGEFALLATLAGFAAGVLLPLGLLGARTASASAALAPAWRHWPGAAAALSGLLIAWAAYRLLTAWRAWRRTPGPSLAGLLRRHQYPLALGAALMGLAGGVMMLVQGPWSYSNHLRRAVLAGWTGEPGPGAAHTALVAALLIGMAASALQRGSFAPRRPAARVLGRHGLGGLLMGAGAALVPGGNDSLLLSALPTLALAAVAAYGGMLAGIAATLWLLKTAATGRDARR